MWKENFQELYNQNMADRVYEAKHHDSLESEILIHEIWTAIKYSPQSISPNADGRPRKAIKACTLELHIYRRMGQRAQIEKRSDRLLLNLKPECKENSNCNILKQLVKWPARLSIPCIVDIKKKFPMTGRNQ